MVKERRKHPRVKKRLRVDFGETDLGNKGFVSDVSVGGIFLVTTPKFKVGTRLHLHIIGGNENFYAEGLVVRVKQVSPQLRRIEAQGVGLRFLSPSELLRVFFPKVARTVETNELVCTSAEDLEKILHEQLAAGIIVVSVPSPPPSPNTAVEFFIQLHFGADPRSLSGEGRVVQILQQGSLRRAVLEVRDAAKLRAELEAALR